MTMATGVIPPRVLQLAQTSLALRALACLLSFGLTALLLWAVLLTDLRSERDALRLRLQAPEAAATPPGHDPQALQRLREHIAAHEQRWMPDSAALFWTAEVQQAAQAPGLSLEQLRVVRDAIDPRHPAFAVAVRLQGSFAGVAGWLEATARAPLAIAMQPVRLSAVPDGGLRLETQALAFRGALPAASAAGAGKLAERSAPVPVAGAPAALVQPVFARSVQQLSVVAPQGATRHPFDAMRLADALGLLRAPAPIRGGPDLARVREPLEAYDLRDIRLLGVLQNGARRLAIVLAGGGHHAVEVGHYLGRQHGRVERIADNALDLQEWEQRDGQWQRRTARLLIQPASRADGGSAD